MRIKIKIIQKYIYGKDIFTVVKRRKRVPGKKKIKTSGVYVRTSRLKILKEENPKSNPSHKDKVYINIIYIIFEK